jgi:predicted nuclease of predicted toxin-antitoxin system
MKLKLDENLSRYLKPELEDLGYDVETVADENLLSQPDEKIAQAARKENRILFSLDTDFADISSYEPGTHPGVVVFRPKSFGPLAVNYFIKKFVTGTDLSKLIGCIVIVEHGRMRVRRPKD